MSATVTIPRAAAVRAEEALRLLARPFDESIARLPDTEGPRKRNVLIELRDDTLRSQVSIKAALEAPVAPPERMVCDFLKVVGADRESLCRESLPLIEQCEKLLDGLKDETWAARDETLVSVRRRLDELRLLVTSTEASAS